MIYINDYWPKFSEMLKENKSYQEVAQQFTIDTGVDCSPQAGKEKVEASVLQERAPL
ncbi:MAG: hypothetical protein NC121_09800 [Blautia sp.]|nr:hypothetical protein [Blautia sp.]